MIVGKKITSCSGVFVIVGEDEKKVENIINMLMNIFRFLRIYITNKNVRYKLSKKYGELFLTPKYEEIEYLKLPEKIIIST